MKTGRIEWHDRIEWHETNSKTTYDAQTKTYAYTTWQFTTENYQQFLTRLANDIQTMNCKIVSMDIDTRGTTPTATILWTPKG